VGGPNTQNRGVGGQTTLVYRVHRERNEGGGTSSFAIKADRRHAYFGLLETKKEEARAFGCRLKKETRAAGFTLERRDRVGVAMGFIALPSPNEERPFRFPLSSNGGDNNLAAAGERGGRIIVPFIHWTVDATFRGGGGSEVNCFRETASQNFSIRLTQQP